ncbi:MAG: xanthine dehydrogenase family protein molybdopterin-binding subunit [Desulfitobacteriaceae bacterium]
MDQKNCIGQSVVRKDAWEKVTGSATYCADLVFPRQLYAAVFRSPLPHARIVGMDLTEVRQLPGVKAVVTGEDFPILFGQFIKDQPFLASRKVRFVGEPVVAVAAETPEIAAEAIRRVHVDFEPLPAVFDVFEAIADGAPLVHEDWNLYRKSGAVRPVSASNICDHFQLRKGDTASGWQEADVVIENEFSTAMIQHVTIETHCAIAQYKRDGSLTVWTPGQSPFVLRSQLAEALDLPLNKVRIIATTIGGGFGSKYELRAEQLAVALAMKAPSRPVKIVFDRQEEFATSVVRGATHVKIKTGAKKDGTLLAQEVTTYLDTGAYSTVGPRINYNAGFAASGPYQVPNVKIDGYCICTNKPIGGAFRGFGVPEVAWAYESQMDLLAKELNIDPLALRIKNAVEEGSISASGERLLSVGVKDCLKAVGEQIGWDSHGPTVTPEGKIRAKGVACFSKLTGTPSNSSVIIRLNEDGSVNVLQSGMEMGQGTTTVIAQIVAEELGIDVDKVVVAPVDTEFTPYEKTTTSSRLTFHVGNAAILAAKDVLEQLKCLAAKHWKVEQEQIRVEAGQILGPSGQSITVNQIKQTSILKEQPPVIGRGSYSTADIFDPPDAATRQSKRPTVFWMYGAQAAEVEVDPETGQVEVLKMVAAHDVGKAINPLGCQQQIEGSCVMGIGHVLLEEMIFDHGKVLNANMVDYKVPTVMDATLEITVTLIEQNHPEGPFGAKGVGEPGIAPTAAAIGNAISEAIGQRIYQLPVKPETIVAALHKNNA